MLTKEDLFTLASPGKCTALHHSKDYDVTNWPIGSFQFMLILRDAIIYAIHHGPLSHYVVHDHTLMELISYEFL